MPFDSLPTIIVEPTARVLPAEPVPLPDSLRLLMNSLARLRNGRGWAQNYSSRKTPLGMKYCMSGVVNDTYLLTATYRFGTKHRAKKYLRAAIRDYTRYRPAGQFTQIISFNDHKSTDWVDVHHVFHLAFEKARKAEMA